MKCKICNANSEFFATATVMKRYNISYFHCKNCDFIQTEEPFWLAEAYKNPINKTDTGLISRNISFSKITSSIIFSFFDKKGLFIDYAGGYGLFTRIMRDSGFNFYWYDPNTQNVFAKGFESKNLTNKYELLTCFEAFEHFKNPIFEIEKIINLSDNILFSTTIFTKKKPPPIDKWWYYSSDHGQHISFYSKITLKYIAKIFKLNFYSNGAYMHILTKKKLNQAAFNFIILMGKYLLRSNKFSIKSLIKDYNLQSIQNQGE